MCGRYSFVPTKKQLKEQMPEVELPADLHMQFNIAPTNQAYVISNDDPRHLQRMEWGLVPFWSKDGINTGKMINARSEGITEKPSFREPVRKRRCLVPADSFYEWKPAPGKRKIPYRILPGNGALLFMAGIWDEWRHDGRSRKTFSILTTVPNEEVSSLHDRMPVLLTSKEAQEAWLSDLNVESLSDLLHPPEEGYLKIYRVSEKLNVPGYDGPELQLPVAEDLKLF
jgi:putative SOS response-associated peptidase YedK